MAARRLPPDVTSYVFFSSCRQYRWLLVRCWAIGPTVIFILLNPSIADEMVDDPTTAGLMARAKLWGFGSYILLNAFALRSTDPAGLLRHPDPIGRENDQRILRALHGHPTAPVVCAWGTWGSHRKLGDRGPALAAMLREHRPLMCLGVTKNAQPVHPLYQPLSAPLVPYL
jgi:hypothetical protein